MGIVLGANSGNLAVIDIDDHALATKAFTTLVAYKVRTRMVWTVSRNLHVYVREERPSNSTAFKVQWEGRTIGVELKAQGTQVAAPPTPGYELCWWKVNEDNSYKEPILPMQVPTVRAAWDSLALRLGVGMPAAGTPSDANYPHPWEVSVPEGDRNKAAFVEGCRLREAGVPIAQALQLMRARFEAAYAGTIQWWEMERTIKSAYQRGELVEGSGVYARWTDEL